ncbi:MAG: FdhF/YdeP family oxidoreductase [Bacteroidota bacterium]
MVGGGFKALRYALKASFTVGFLKILPAMFSKNTCKSCALGMGGQKGGMSNEMGRFPEVCKKAFQAQITDIQDAIPEKIFHLKSIQDFQQTPARLLERSGRLNNPIYKAEGQTHYVPISWEQALEKIATRIMSTKPERSFFYSSGRSSNEAAFLLQLFGRAYGTNNIHNCSYYCHQATGIGMNSTLGTGTATLELQDLEKADLIFVIGANPASNHPRFVRQLMYCRRRGGNVIVINPVKEKGLLKFAIPSDLKSLLSGGSSIASEYVQIQIGGDIAILKGIAKAILESGKQDLNFMEAHTNGKDEFVKDIQETSWETIVCSSGIEKKRIQQIAEIYGNSTNVIFCWAMGITHHEHGVENVESIVNLALLRGMVGRPYAGLLPLRGQSNIQGIGSLGVTPILKEKIFENLEKISGIHLPTEPGMDTISCLKAAHEGKIDFAFLLGGNLFQSSPDTKFTETALNAIPFKVFLNTSLNKGHFFGVEKEVLVLPVAARDEEKQKTTQESLFNFVRMSDGGINRLGNVRSEVEIISDIAQKVLPDAPVDFKKLKSHQNLRTFIAQTVQGYEKLSTIEETGEEFHVANRSFHQPIFGTPNQKANFKLCKIPSLMRNDGQFKMMTVRSEGQYNTVIYEENDLYREQKNRQIVMMNEEDIQEIGLKENDMVSLESSVGRMENLKVRKIDISRGNIMTYYPESNILVPNTTDPRSNTPGFKSIWVNIEKKQRAQT